MDKDDGKSLFLEFFGGRPFFRVVDFLLENRLQDFSKSEIARGAGVSWATLYNHWPKLEKQGIVKATRKVGNITLYQLNESNPLVKSMKRMELALIERAANAEEANAKMKVRPAQALH
ncbi:Uncharacterised protein [Candidatus Burarchaeum australiense]|nr:Uncharacterised protein [Candidatus Burarchaeum australiense]